MICPSLVPIQEGWAERNDPDSGGRESENDRLTPKGHTVRHIHSRASIIRRNSSLSLASTRLTSSAGKHRDRRHALPIAVYSSCLVPRYALTGQVTGRGSPSVDETESVQAPPARVRGVLLGPNPTSYSLDFRHHNKEDHPYRNRSEEGRVSVRNPPSEAQIVAAASRAMVEYLPRVTEIYRESIGRGLTADEQTVIARFRLTQLAVELPMASLGNCSVDGTPYQFEDHDGDMWVCCAQGHCWTTGWKTV